MGYGDRALIRLMVSVLWMMAGTGILLAQNTNTINSGIQFDSAGARSLGMGGAFVAVADDASTVYGNPAGLTTFTGIEVSAELRQWNFFADTTNRGHAFGQPSGRGVDTVAGLQLSRFATHHAGPAFLSLVVPKGAWGFGAFYRSHTRYTMDRRLEGPFFHCSGGYRGGADPTPPPYCEPHARADGIDRVFPTNENIDVGINALGMAVSYAPRWPGLSIGVGVQRMSFDMEADVTAFAARDGQKFAPANYSFPSNVDGTSRQVGHDGGWAFTTGVLWNPGAQFAVGASYQWQPSFTFCTTTATGDANPAGPQVYVTSYDATGPCASEKGASAGSFALPRHFVAGASYRVNLDAPNYFWLVSAQYDWVNYSSLLKGFGDVSLPPDSPEGKNVLSHLRIEDANGIRGGTEVVVLTGSVSNAPTAVTLRAGVFYEPQHQVYFQPDDPATGFPSPRYALYLPKGNDIWHRSVGVGVMLGRTQLDFAIDLAQTGHTLALSTVMRF